MAASSQPTIPQVGKLVSVVYGNPLVIAHNEVVANGNYSDLSVLKKPPSTPPRFVRLQTISPINSKLSNDGSTAMPKRLASLPQSLRSLSNP